MKELPNDPLSGFGVEYYDYDCGSPCTPDGCYGHPTDIPLSFTLGGVTFHVEGSESGDFPDEKENVERVCAVVKALGELIKSAHDRTNNAPYWLCYAMAEWFEVADPPCEHPDGEGGLMDCSETSLCITEWCAPCAAHAWLEEQKRLAKSPAKETK